MTGFWDNHLRIIEGRLTASGKPFVAGTDAPTIADFKLIAQWTTTFPDMTSACVIPEDVQAQVQAKIDAHPQYKSWAARMKEVLAAYLAARPPIAF